MNKVKILAVGAGGFANNYIGKMLNEEGDFEFVGAVEVRPESCLHLDELKKRNIPIYGTMEEFYEHSSADLAVICTPIFLHTAQTLTALENGSNVLCEKPLSAVSEDAELIEQKAKEKGLFVMTGYQWSYSDAILSLKKDILSGVYGRPELLKTLILWPRNTDYFARGGGWAGRIKIGDTLVYDSIAANATAHYLHNMLFVTGEENRSSEALNVSADLLRVNGIENFDTSVISFELSCGGKALFVASHTTVEQIDPTFEYRFEKGTVTFDSADSCIRATLKDGRVIEYGDPSKDVHTHKVYEAIRGCKTPNYVPVCSPYTAAAHTRCIEAVQKESIYDVNKAWVKTRENYLYAEGLKELLVRCYEEEKMLREYKEYGELIK